MTRVLASGPRLYLIARPELDFDAVSAFLADNDVEWRRTPSASTPDELVELAGRVCYMSFGRRQSPQTNSQYVARLVEQGHHSVLEHASWTFLLSGVSRAFTHQFVRHRIGFSYSQLSQQYHDERETAAVMPDTIRVRSDLAAIWRRAVDGTQEAYEEILDELGTDDIQLSEREARRLMRSAARTVLPSATETKIAFTANARALRHFLTERGSLAGDEEMRAVSVLIFEALRVEAPALFADFASVEGPAGLEVVRGAATRPGRLVVVTGPSHAGKTTTIELVRQGLATPTAVIAVDDIIARLDLAAGDTWKDGLPAAYDVAVASASALLRRGFAVFVESTFTFVPDAPEHASLHEDQLQRLLDVAETVRSPSLVVRLSAELDVLQKRHAATARLDRAVVDGTSTLHRGWVHESAVQVDTARSTPAEAAALVLEALGPIEQRAD